MKEINLKDKIVVIAGATGGIGKEISIACAKRGAIIIALGRNTSDNDSLLNLLKTFNPKSQFRELDISDYSNWETLSSNLSNEFRCVDYFIHSAGLLLAGSLDDLKYESINKIIEVNLNSVIWSIKGLKTLLKQSSNPGIIVIGSQGGLVPMPYQPIYAATKSAVRNLVLSLRYEFTEIGINICLVSPGPVNTRMLETEANDERAVSSFISKPMNPSEVADYTIRALKFKKLEYIIPGHMDFVTRITMLFPELYAILYKNIEKFAKNNLLNYRKNVKTIGGSHE
jgi:short-subunit dehydrogenase